MSRPKAGKRRQKATGEKKVASPAQTPDDAVPAVATGIPVGRWTLRPYPDGWTIGRWVTYGDRMRWRNQTFYGRRAHALRALCDLVERDEAENVTTLRELRALVEDVHHRVCSCLSQKCLMGEDHD